MPNVAQPEQMTDVLLFEEDREYSREVVTVLAGQVLVPGRTLGRITASGKYIGCIQAAVDGSETEVAVALFHVDASAADVEATVLIEHAVVKRAGLVIESGDDLAQAEAALAAVGIKTRESA